MANKQDKENQAQNTASKSKTDQAVLRPPDVQEGSKKTATPKQNKQNWSTGYGPLSSLVITIGLFLFSQIIVVFAIGIYAVLQGQDISFVESFIESNRNLFFISFVISVVQFIGLILFLRLKRKKFRSISLVQPVAKDIVRAVTGWLVYIGIFVVLAVVLQGADTGIDFEQEQQLDFTAPSIPGELYLIFIALVILPALIEEILMRGFLFHSLRSKLSFWHSTLVVSVLFGFAHVQFATGEPLLWVAFIDTFILSIVLCYMTERFRTLWPAILAHAIKNGIAFTFLFVVQT